MKIVFFGTPDYILPILNSLDKTFKSKSGQSPVIAVVTQKPKPVGRKKIVSFSPVDKWAHKRTVPVFYESNDILEKNIQADVGILASFGQILSKEVIDTFPNGILNIHPSLLPKYRGASPVQASIVAGDKQTGVTIIKLDEKLDHGLIVSQFTESIKANDTTQSLRLRLFENSAQALTELLPHYLKGKIALREQEHGKASFTTQMKKEHGFIPGKFLNSALKGKTVKEKWNLEFLSDFTLNPDPQVLERFIRAMVPWPIAWTKITIQVSGRQTVKRIKILGAHLENAKLVFDKVQLEGKKQVSWKQFRDGYPKVTFG